MIRAARLTLTGTVLALVASAAGQVDSDDRPGRDDDSERDKPFFYMPISLATVENVLERGTDDWARGYDFDDEQRETMRQVVKDHFIPFLRKNRGTLQDLVAQFIEVQTGLDSPEIDGVADWAQRALPLLNQFKDMLDDTTEEMRAHMTEDQQLELDGQHAAMQAGFIMLRRKVAGWADGGFDPETEWYPSHARPGERRGRRNPEPTGPIVALDENHQPGPVTTQPAATSPNDEWTKYVEKFIERYELGLTQRQDASRQLRTHRAERDSHLSRPRTVRDMQRVKKLMQDAESEQEKTAAQKQLERLEKRVDIIFQHLKDTLEKIPTRDQRARAAEKTMEEKATADKADRPGTDSGEEKEDPGSP